MQVMARYENSHAYVNLAACVTVTNGVIQNSPSPVVVFGGAYGKATRVTVIEQSLVGMNVTDQVKACYLKYIVKFECDNVLINAFKLD